MTPGIAGSKPRILDSLAIDAQTIPQIASPLATSLCLFCSDIAAVLIARGFALLFWHRINPVIGTEHDFGLWVSTALFPLAFAVYGLYGAGGLSPVDELKRVTQGALLVSLILTASIFLLRDLSGYSRGLFISSFVMIAGLVPLNRAVVRHFYSSKAWWGIPVLVLGAGKTGRAVVESLRLTPSIGLKPIVCLDDSSAITECSGVPVAGPLSLAPELGRRLGIRHALIAMPMLQREQLTRLIERWCGNFSHVIVIPNLFGIATLWVEAQDLGGVLGLEVRQNLLVPFNRWLKRGMDVLLGVFFGLLALPIIGLAAVWIKIASPGRAIYTQEREGENGELIRIHKLRTMLPDADQLLDRHLEMHPEDRAEWNKFFKLKHDPRIIPGVGKILRRTSLDELPQIWNVLTGQMSLVGPRPFPVYHMEHFDPEFRELRCRVTPGLTGLWQVSARSDGDIKVQEALDVYYIRNWSPWLDLHILVRTVFAVVLLRGAY